ncbi:MAG: DUF4290 domain-containing protein [Paludibacteraceae bacterium]|jgi:hypothetical protein|nr:DUF4290 domain-containing protein [Paludibacteraceae bacterium]
MQGLRKTSIVRMRNYGRIIQDMVQLAVEEQDNDKKQSMIVYIAQCMRQKNATWNRELESGNDRLKDDIYILSNGKLSCDFELFDETMDKLAQRPIATSERQQKKKKK